MARTQYTKKIKAEVAIAAIKAQQTVAELCSEYKVHATQVNSWKKELLDNAVTVFDKKSTNSERKHIEERDRIYQKVGQLQVEVDFLKKAAGLLK